MKKLAVCFIVLLISCSVFMSFVFAENNVVESPHVKIAIDGEIGTYADVPIIVNGRTLLPLREVLVNLGVQNDNDHIIWDGVKRSVTVIKDSKTIYLEVGNKTASVDGNNITLDVDPMIYSKNNRTYIPARFVAESLGKVVMWDASTTSVLITDEDKFNEVKDILGKSKEAMAKLKKYKFVMKTEMDGNIDGKNVKMAIETSTHADLENNSNYHKMTMNMAELQGIDMTFIETYLKDKVSYTKTFLLGNAWIKSEVSDEEIQQSFKDNDNTNLIEINDILCAGLAVTESGSDIQLKGDIYIDELFKKGLSASTTATGNDDVSTAYNLEKFNVNITLDKATYRVKSMNLLFNASLKDTSEQQTKLNMVMKTTYDYDETFEIVVPEEVIENAKDAVDLSLPQQ